MPTIIAACSNRKRLAPGPGMQASELPHGTLEQVSSEWLRRVRSATPTMPAIELYHGRAFREALRAAKTLSARLLIASAGMGLLSADVAVPGYSLTVSRSSPQCVLSRVSSTIAASDWWGKLASASPVGCGLEHAIGRQPADLILAPLPSSYVAMLSGELLSLSHPQIERIRIFTRGDVGSIDDRIRALIMPYDERFDGPASPIRGTLADFAQRAAHHFAREIIPDSPNGTPDEHRRLVRKASSAWVAPTIPTRERRTDTEIKQLILENWDLVAGRSSRMLRLLRDDLVIACEQSRFKDLFAEVRAQRAAA
jgi:hypothetical protein